MRAGPRAIRSAIETIPCSLKIRARTDVSLNQASRWAGMRARPYACCDNRAGFLRISQPKLQGRISAHAQADQMGAFDLEIPHHRGDIVDRELPAIQRCIFGDITRWVASGIVGNATIAREK